MKFLDFYILTERQLGKIKDGVRAEQRAVSNRLVSRLLFFGQNKVYRLSNGKATAKSG